MLEKRVGTARCHGATIRQVGNHYIVQTVSKLAVEKHTQSVLIIACLRIVWQGFTLSFMICTQLDLTGNAIFHTFHSNCSRLPVSSIGCFLSAEIGQRTEKCFEQITAPKSFKSFLGTANFFESLNPQPSLQTYNTWAATPKRSMPSVKS